MRIGVAAGLLLVGAAVAMPPAPPIKMGLWEMTSTKNTRVMGLDNSGQVFGASNTTTVKICVIEETWQKSLGGLGDPGLGCTRTNVVSTPEKLSGKLTCAMSGGSTMTGEQTTFFDSPEQTHATQHLTSSSSAGSSVVDATIKGRFLSPDCGDVKPLTGRSPQ